MGICVCGSLQKPKPLKCTPDFWVARYGDTANVSARKRAISFKMKGDLEGHKVWNEVAASIDDRVKNNRRVTHQETVTSASLNNI